jgi:Kef-type K+ transport system membrane component KefB
LGLMDIYSPDDPLLGASSVFGQLSELYANFGGIGIVLGMFAWGVIYASIEKLRETARDSLAFFVYLQLFFCQLWFFRHGLLGMVQSMIIPVLLAPIFIKLAYARTSRAHAGRVVPRPVLCPQSK